MRHEDVPPVIFRDSERSYKEAWLGTFRLEELGQVYAMIGEQGKAVEVLERLLAIPSECTIPMLRAEPRWKSLRGNARVRSLVRDQHL